MRDKKRVKQKEMRRERKRGSKMKEKDEKKRIKHSFILFECGQCKAKTGLLAI